MIWGNIPCPRPHIRVAHHSYTKQVGSLQRGNDFHTRRLCLPGQSRHPQLGRRKTHQHRKCNDELAYLRIHSSYLQRYGHNRSVVCASEKWLMIARPGSSFILLGSAVNWNRSSLIFGTCLEWPQVWRILQIKSLQMLETVSSIQAYQN